MDWGQLAILGRAALAALLGGAIGVEREISDKPAGLRTQIIVCTAAALLVPLGDVLLAGYKDSSFDKTVQSDPIRIVQAIIAGIAFLGAGTILRRGKAEKVEGLTTAASLLLTASVGIAVALGQYILAVGATLLTLGVLVALHPIEHWLLERFSNKTDDPHSN